MLHKICCLVTDDNLGKALRALHGLSEGDVTVATIPRAERKDKGVPRQKSSTTGRAIIEAEALIRTLDFEWTTAQAYLACAGTNVHKSAIDRAINAMLVAGKIERLSRGRYRQPKGGNGPFHNGQRKMGVPGQPTEL